MAASNEGKVTGKTNVGGIGGYLTGTDTICDSFNSGEINGETEIGGIAGYNYKSYSDNEGYFHNLYNAETLQQAVQRLQVSPAGELLLRYRLVLM